MRRMIMLLTASALIVMVWAVPASAEIIEPGLTVSEGGVVIESSVACNTLAGTAGFEGQVRASPPNNPFPPTVSGGEVCWLELPGWNVAAAHLASASSSTASPTEAKPAPGNPFPPT
jgi:hypothetical protein